MLANLAANNPDNQVTIAAAGGIEVAIEAMKKHSEVALVQEKGCVMLENLAMNDDNRVKIAKAGGIELAIEAMKKHSRERRSSAIGLYCPVVDGIE